MQTLNEALKTAFVDAVDLDGQAGGEAKVALVNLITSGVEVALFLNALLSFDT